MFFFALLPILLVRTNTLYICIANLRIAVQDAQARVSHCWARYSTGSMGIAALVTYTILLNTGPRFAAIYYVGKPAVSKLKTGLHGTRGASSEALQ